MVESQGRDPGMVQVADDRVRYISSHLSFTEGGKS